MVKRILFFLHFLCFVYSVCVCPLMCVCQMPSYTSCPLELADSSRLASWPVRYCGPPVSAFPGVKEQTRPHYLQLFFTGLWRTCKHRRHLTAPSLRSFPRFFFSPPVFGMNSRPHTCYIISKLKVSKYMHSPCHLCFFVVF